MDDKPTQWAVVDQAADRAGQADELTEDPVAVTDAKNTASTPRAPLNAEKDKPPRGVTNAPSGEAPAEYS